MQQIPTQENYDSGMLHFSDSCQELWIILQNKLWQKKKRGHISQTTDPSLNLSAWMPETSGY